MKVKIKYNKEYINKMIIEHICPQCKEKDSLYVEQYGDTFFDHGAFKITCDCCSFTCPRGSSDYKEAWETFRSWLNDKVLTEMDI